MNDEQMRIALAEAFPELFLRPTGQAGWNYKSSVTGRISPCVDGDPLKDLNAIYEAVKALDRETQYDSDEGFTYQLAKVVHEDPDEAGWNFYELQEATSHQRAEAVIRTLGRYKEEPLA
jgi:hypothetical protein